MMKRKYKAPHIDMVSRVKPMMMVASRRVEAKSSFTFNSIQERDVTVNSSTFNNFSSGSSGQTSWGYE